jgi:toxin ParE1/3/4
MHKSPPQIIISEQAEFDLDEISDYIEAQSGEARTRAVLQKISAEITTLATNPNFGSKRDSLCPNLRSIVVFRYIVFYEPMQNGVKILRVLHGSRDL